MDNSRRNYDAIKRSAYFIVFLLLALALAINGGVKEKQGLLIARWLSGPIYIGYIVIAVGLLFNPYVRFDRMKRAWSNWWTIEVALGSLILSQGLKALIRLPRPSGSLSGFPSGHTLFAIALAGLLTARYPKSAPVWYALAVAIGWSRIDTDAHFPYQVIIGGLIGAVLVIAVRRKPRGWVAYRVAAR